MLNYKNFWIDRRFIAIGRLVVDYLVNRSFLQATNETSYKVVLDLFYNGGKVSDITDDDIYFSLIKVS